MPHHDTTALSGVIQHVFAHRFTVEAGGGTHLADLGPKGAEAFPLVAGLYVDIEGERRPSEIKVTRIAAEGREPVHIQHKKPRHPPGDKRPDMPADPSRVLEAVKGNRTAAARTLEIGRNTLARKLKEYGLADEG